MYNEAFLDRYGVYSDLHDMASRLLHTDGDLIMLTHRLFHNGQFAMHELTHAGLLHNNELILLYPMSAYYHIMEKTIKSAYNVGGYKIGDFMEGVVRDIC